MINRLSDYIARTIISNSPEGMFKQDQIVYGIKFIITNIVPIILMIIYGILVSDLFNVIAAILGFSVLRTVTGGYHIKSSELCIIVSIVMVFLLSRFSYMFISHQWILNCISLLLVVIFAPSNIREQTKLPEKFDLHLKCIAIFIIIVNIIIKNEVVCFSIFVQSLLLIRFRKGGEV